MNEEIKALRRDVDGLIEERHALLGVTSALFKVLAAIMQTYPDHAVLHLAIHRLIDSQEMGLQDPLTHGEAEKAERQTLDALLSLAHAPPKPWTPTP